MNGSDDSLKSLKLENWVMNKVESWRDFYQSNLEAKHDEYYRIWRGIWSAEDKTRESERSRLISPATQQAVESAVAEVEEATFGRGKFFDIRDDRQDEVICFDRPKTHRYLPCESPLACLCSSTNGTVKTEPSRWNWPHAL